jgi:hypothetical protein
MYLVNILEIGTPFWYYYYIRIKIKLSNNTEVLSDRYNSYNPMTIKKFKIDIDVLEWWKNSGLL